MYLPCVFLIIFHLRFDRTIKNNYFSWLLPLNRGAAFCRISRILVKLHCWALLREFVTTCWGELTGRVKFTPQIHLGVQMWPLFSILHTLSLDIHKLHIRLNEWLNLLGARGFWKKMLDFDIKISKAYGLKGLKCWAWPKVYVGCKYTNLICI